LFDVPRGWLNISGRKMSSPDTSVARASIETFAPFNALRATPHCVIDPARHSLEPAMAP
jgi:hypothetical protein